jgi:hypothetical protein
MLHRSVLFAFPAILLSACGNSPPPTATTASTVGAAPAGGATAEDDSARGEPGAEGDEGALPAPAPNAQHDIGAAGVVAEVDRELGAVKSSSYTHHTVVDEARGEFDYDCSGFAGYALERSAPEAFAEVQKATVQRPLAKHFEAFFASLPTGAPHGHWQGVSRVQDLAIGDLVAWLRPTELSNRNTGHVVFVHGPVSAYQGRNDAFVVPIADATHAPHGKSDPRKSAEATGLGTGSIVLLTDAGGRPVGYKWSTWSRSVEHMTPVAMGRVIH